MRPESTFPTEAELKKAVKAFQATTKEQADENSLHHRYHSFDICYNYFCKNRKNLTGDIEKSCCVLWSYLGSWGMLRGSSFLLKEKNPAFLINLIKYIENDCQDVFDVDVDKYGNKGVIDRVLDVYAEIYTLLGGDATKPSSTLITKIMLGVFGCIPAFDQFFCETLGDLTPSSGIKSKRVTKNSLTAIFNFYTQLKSTVDTLAASCNITDPFDAKNHTISYTKAKIIDMYGFNAGITKGDTNLLNS